MKKKRVLSAFLALAMLLSLCTFAQPVRVNAAQTYTDGYYTYEVVDSEAVITRCDTSVAGDITIPSTLGSYPVTAIGSYAFEFCEGLTGAVIPEGVRSIDYGAFMCCYGLSSVTIPASVTSIGDGVFGSCYSLADVYYTGEQYQWYALSIGMDNDYLNYATIHFGNTSAEPLPDGILEMGTCGADMTWSLEETGTLTISGSGEMTDFYASRTPWWSFRTSIRRVVFSGSITRIGNYAFSSCTNLTEISIPDSVKHIGENAFVSCTGLTDINIGDGVTSIGASAFSSCTALTGFYIGKNVSEIGDYAFNYCICLSAIWVDDDNQTYASDNGILYNKEKTTLLYAPEGYTGSYTVPDGVTVIADRAFSYCEKLTDITIGSSVTTLGDSVFNRCYGLTDVTLSNGITTLGGSVFYYCTALTQIVLPDSITTMGSAVFQGCETLSFAALGSDVTSLDYYAFDGCINLKSVYIPASVTNISRYVFDDCDSLTDVYYGGTQEQWENVTVGTYNDDLLNAQIRYNTADLIAASGTCGENLVWYLDLAGTLTITGTGPMTNYVYNSALSTKSTHPWDDTANAIRKIVIEDGVTSIGANAFTYFPNLTTVVIPNSVTAIQTYAFWHCVSLTDVVIPSKVTSIGDCAFRDCSGLTQVNIPIGILSINSGLFAGCSSLKEITIPDNVTMIGRSAFEKCTGLTEITIPSRVISIDLNAFYECVGLTNVYYIGTQEQWQAIGIDGTNGYLTGATIHYNSSAIAARIGALTYSSLAAALASAQPGATVQLLADVQAENVLLADGVTLDINGHTLTVDALTAYAEELANGYVIDNSEGNGGLLIVEKEKAAFHCENPDVPLYDTASGGYRFFDYKLDLFADTTNEGVGKERFWFRFHFYTNDTCAALDGDAYSAVLAGGSGMEVRTTLTWNERVLPQVQFVRDGSADTFVKAWANGATAARCFYVTVSGLNKCGNGTLQLAPVFCANGVEMTNGSVVYKVEDSYGWSEGIQ